MSTVNLENLIYDRTQEDLDNDTDKAYIDYADLNRIEGACAELAEILGVSIETKTWEMSDWRYEADMQRIRNNIVKLTAVYQMTGFSAPSAIEFTSIEEANALEKLLHDLWWRYKSFRAGLNTLAFTMHLAPLGNRKVE